MVDLEGDESVERGGWWWCGHGGDRLELPAASRSAGDALRSRMAMQNWMMMKGWMIRVGGWRKVER